MIFSLGKGADVGWQLSAGGVAREVCGSAGDISAPNTFGMHRFWVVDPLTIGIHRLYPLANKQFAIQNY